MRQDRFLTGILIGIAALIIVALVLFFARKDTEVYTDDSTPQGVAQNYIVALHKRDFNKAYDYLAEGKYKPTFDEFQRAFVTKMVVPDNAGVEIGQATITGQDAAVDLYIIYGSGDPFSSDYRNTELALLTKQDDDWKITQMPYSYWYYDWYQKPVDFTD
jgi:hypothetical protein